MKNIWLTLLLTSITWVQANTEERRIALIIGNAVYDKDILTLPNPENDATDMAQTLRELGFEVIEGHNLDKKQMYKKMDLFEQKLHEGDKSKTVGLFYYAGHGMEVEGINYLLPTDADITYREEVSRAGVQLKDITKTMNRSNNLLNIVILDACRNNPLPKRPENLGRTPSTFGWSKLQNVATGMFVAYGTSEGHQAFDGSDRNGLFTKYLLKNIKTKGLILEQVFKYTRKDVLDASKALGFYQVTDQTNKTYGDFYFNPIEIGNINNNAIVSIQPINSSQTSSQTVNSNIKKWWNDKDEPAPQAPEGTVWSEDGKLMWMRCSLGQKWNKDKKSCNDKAKEYNWKEAKTEAKNYNYGDHTDWRVPTIEELETLIYCSTSRKPRDSIGRLDGCQTGYTSPTIDLNKFPDTTTSSLFWSSSPYASSMEYSVAWVVSFYNGNSNGISSNTRVVRLVRFAQ
ncbi:MAG: caspase family protein [Alcanivoracaceae bacterium]|nr:caspase family protein [Alcanivoracaceae bacterium]